MKPSTLGEKGWTAFHWKLQGLGLLFITFLSFYPRFFHYEEYLFFFLLLTSVGAAIFQGRDFWVRSPIDLPLVLLVGWILLTIPFSIDPSYSFSEWRKVAGRILVFYWVLLVLRHHPKRELWRHVIWIVVLGAFMLSVLGITEFITKGGTLFNRSQRAGGFGAHSHWLATYMVLAVPFVFFLFIRAKGTWNKLVFGFISLLILVTEFLTYSRGGWLALASQGMGFGMLSGKRRTFFLFLFWGLVGFSILFGAGQIGYLGGVFEKESIVDRLGCWSIGIQELTAHPFVGVGFGNDIFIRLYPGNPPGDCTGGHLHNTLLMFGMGSGVLGLLLLLWVFMVIIKNLSRCAMNKEGSEGRPLRMAVAIMALGYVVSMTFNYLFTGSLAYLFWILVAVGFYLRSEQGMVSSGNEKLHAP